MIDVKDFFERTDEFIGQQVKINGWIRKSRGSKNIAFIELNDGTYFENLQIIASKDLVNFDEVSKYSIAAAIEVEGELVETPNMKQPFELQASKVVLLADSDSDYPLQNKRHTFEYLREIAHLRPRSNTFSAVFRVRSLAAQAIHEFFQNRGYIYAHTPIITGSDAEGAGDMFRVTTLDINEPPRDEKGKVDESKDFFGKETNLTVSGQLEAEIFALAFKKTYTFGPTFRSENSNTARHASEFWMIEPEVAFADINDNMDIAEDMIKYLINYVMKHAKPELEFFNKFIDKTLLDRLNNVVNNEFAKVSYTEAIELLKEADKTFEYKVEWGVDLQTEHERYLTEEIYKKPVFVIDYPKDIKAFYMRENEDKKTVAAMDLLVPGVGEIVGGSQREERLEVLEAKIDELGLNKEDYWWYLELRKYGGVKHSGFGLGFERAIMYLTGMKNIRDVIAFPRTPGTAEF
ncbi:MAG TPA: asparagine--tRNA ligase [Clostridia bacterium]|nr:asparagine--tRNA ligase [Clostridia bacterium]